MSILQNSNAISAGGYDINNSVRLRRSASAYLQRTSSHSTQTYTYSFWMKKGPSNVSAEYIFGYYNGAGSSAGFRITSDQLEWYSYALGMNAQVLTTQVFRDPSAWYHVVGVMDTTNATSTERIRLYINGVRVTAGTFTYPSLNFNTYMGNNLAWAWGISGGSTSGSTYFDGYLTEINVIDGQALNASYFGETDTTTGSWIPKKYTGTYGTGGYYLKFSDIATTSGSNAGLGKDFSGNTNYWTTNNISVTSGTTYDAMTDSPTLTSATVANYAVMNPTIANTTNLINANLTRNGAVRTNVASMVCTNGKYYFETTIQDSNGNGGVGVKQTTAYPLEGYDTSKCATYFSNGEYKIEGGTQTSGFSTYTNGDVIGIAIDTTLSTPKIWFAKNNTWQGTGDPTTAGYSLTSGLDYYFAILHGSSASSTTASANFGQRPFAYTPPTGYKALNTYNLPDSTIKKGNSYMDVTTYTGTGATRSLTGFNFQPDFTWFKTRNVANSNVLFDSIRGVGKELFSDLTNAEVTRADSLTAFNSNGVTLGADSGQGVNANTQTQVGWFWNAGSGTTSSNTSGSITSTVSVNATAGFSVVTWTNPSSGSWTIGHGLGVAPAMIIAKARSAIGGGWLTYHKSLGNSNYLTLNTTNASSAGSWFLNNTSPTSSIITCGDAASWGASAPYVAYCWAEIAGFSKFGSYTGNGSADGPFVYTGFRPKFVIIKSSVTAGGSWIIQDTSRNIYNAAPNRLFPNTSDAEGTSSAGDIDILSNGFKIRNTSGSWNTNGEIYIYAAFAENPFKNANAR